MSNPYEEKEHDQLKCLSNVKENVPKNPVGAITPSSFSYENRAVDEAFGATGAKAAAAAMRDEARMSFMLAQFLTIIKVVNDERSVTFVFRNT